MLFRSANVGVPAYWRAFDTDSIGRMYFTYQNSNSSAPKGIFLVYGMDTSFSQPILVFEDNTGTYITRGSSSVAAQGDGNIAVLFDVAGSRGGQVFSDIFLKQGNIISTSVFDEQREIVSSPELYNNYPNPFNPSTIFKFQLPTSSVATLKVYDILGNVVATLFNNEEMQKGEHEIEFDGSTLPSGVYFYKLSTPTFSQTKKLLLTK